MNSSNFRFILFVFIILTIAELILFLMRRLSIKRKVAELIAANNLEPEKTFHSLSAQRFAMCSFTPDGLFVSIRTNATIFSLSLFSHDSVIPFNNIKKLTISQLETSFIIRSGTNIKDRISTFFGPMAQFSDPILTWKVNWSSVQDKIERLAKENGIVVQRVRVTSTRGLRAVLIGIFLAVTVLAVAWFIMQ